jgi:hypothetical protein
MIDDGDIRSDRMAGEEGILGWDPIRETINIWDPAKGGPPPRKIMIISVDGSYDEDDISDAGRYDYLRALEP